ncbi:hypothetical protein SEA_KIKO_47 [Gordonia phage Kiko]|uniref:hypothetical protein n=1 Tax=Gordonia rubripertincta TaxID=36822 RepID=UPI000FDF72A4|nr:hypothetical protein [Gordonia rubripertincta]AZV00771.1 hypothetical protein SEA_KIKO_47 [Gordonia phage Kiko]QMU22530.1 hypothetical protein H3V45_08705 [Gordonia rubripertincta]
MNLNYTPPANPFADAIARAMAKTAPDGHREPTEFEKAVLVGLQSKPVYQGYTDDQVIIHSDGTETVVPDPRIARTERRRAKNKVARKSRRINRIRSAA